MVDYFKGQQTDLNVLKAVFDQQIHSENEYRNKRINRIYV